MIRFLPYLLIGVRLIITFFSLLDALDGSVGSWFVPVFCLAVFLDVIDGMVARRLGVATQSVRSADSVTDFIMVVVYLVIAWLIHRSQIVPYLDLIISLFGFTLLSFVLATLKFGRLPPYHTNSADSGESIH